ncbi:hypothetical protein H6F90_10660 [Trichocoleus sp. FACHB-591]|uniref:hypothetical protein n=1 Tax=Trichocoleus sp. FACHB-591 TaxID=2692872 RepID=UPI0016887019|nr:hypothetical protein [Trichocoleus sp. FACHB-591]MBD2095615.1 hypothetical protein [Trichocoleus sp. FACHB-591]
MSFTDHQNIFVGMTEQGHDRYPVINRKSMIVACDAIATPTKRQSGSGVDGFSRSYNPG